MSICPNIGKEDNGEYKPVGVCPYIGTERECVIDGVLCSARKNRLYLIDVNDEEFVILNRFEIYSLAYHVTPSTVAELIGNALKIKCVNLDAQDLADADTDAPFVDICDKAVFRHEEAQAEAA